MAKVGITSYGIYIPWHRMERKVLADAWGGFAIPGEKAVASYDEDSLTMAVAACMNCLEGFDPRKVDGLFFATSTSPYKEKQCSAIMALTLDFRRDIYSADITTSLRSGTTAMALATDSIKAGTTRSVLVAAADMRVAAPGGMLEQSLGDGAAAILLGTDDNLIAEIIGTYSIADELAGTWRSYEDAFVRSWEDRMVLDEGYSKILPEAMSGLMKKYGLGPKDFSKVVFDPPTDVRRHGRVASELGFEPSQVQDAFNLFLKVGITGTAMAPIMLAAALEEAKPGDRILFASFGNGADAFVLQVTDGIEKARKERGLNYYLDNKRMLTNYQTYLRWRDLVPQEPARRPEKQHISLAAVWRERKVILGLWGIKCRRCGTPQYDNGAMSTTPIRVCGVCQAQDDFDDYCFARKRGAVFSYTQDSLAAVADPPASVVLVDFEGGGRAFFDLTDRDPAEVRVGMPVEMTFRKVHFDRGLSNYFWKAKPVR